MHFVCWPVNNAEKTLSQLKSVVIRANQFLANRRSTFQSQAIAFAQQSVPSPTNCCTTFYTRCNISLSHLHCLLSFW